MLTRVLPQDPVCLCCFCITSLLFPPTVNGQHHKGLSFPKPVTWSRARMGKMSRPHVPVFCQPPLTRISPCWCLYPSFHILCPFKCFKAICLPAFHVSYTSLTQCWCFYFSHASDANASWCGCCCGHCCDVTMWCSDSWMLILQGISNNGHWIFLNLIVCGYKTPLSIGANSVVHKIQMFGLFKTLILHVVLSHPRLKPVSKTTY